MGDQGIEKFLESSLGLLSADVFSHPVWLNVPIADLDKAEHLAGILQGEVAQLAAQEDWLDACRLSLACAFLQNLAGNIQAALEQLRSTDRMARLGGLSLVVIWVEWGTSAVYVQAGDYPQAVEHLQRLQQDLYSENQWVLADVIDLVRQSLMEWYSTGHRPIIMGTDRAGLLIDHLLKWGRPPEAVVDKLAVAERVLASSPQHGFWRTLLRFLRGELRLELVETDRRDKPHISAAPRTQELPLPSELSPPQRMRIPGRGLPSPPLEVLTPDDTSQNLEETRLVAKDIVVPITSIPVSPPRKQTELRGRRVRLRPLSGEGEPVQAQLLKVCMLGSFRVELEGMVIDTWPSGRSKAVFAYLLAHHPHPVSREVLMETFWPETTIDSARNSLNVAVYNLRHTLKDLSNSPVILLHESTAYQVNPNLRLWLDILTFEEAAHEGRSCQKAGAVESAMQAYQAAIGLYQGDFLSDTPFEGWTTMERERLRVLYLETLDHLSMIYFNQNQYAECIDLCQQIISHDACREDAHSRLMRCYARQGQTTLAMRQFQVCVEALHDELDVPPSPRLVHLCEQIKRQEPV